MVSPGGRHGSAITTLDSFPLGAGVDVGAGFSISHAEGAYLLWCRQAAKVVVQYLVGYSGLSPEKGREQTLLGGLCHVHT